MTRADSPSKMTTTTFLSLIRGINVTITSVERRTSPRTGVVDYRIQPKRAPSNDSDPDLSRFIGHLNQYQELLADRIKRDVSRQALSLLEKSTRSTESEIPHRVQAVLDQAQERISEIIQEELKSIFGGLSDHLQSLRVNVEGSESTEVVETETEDKSLKKMGDLNLGYELGEEIVPEEEEQGVLHQETVLELPPPLDLRLLLGFYRGLLNQKDLRLIRALGSLDKGVSLYIRQQRTTSLTQLLGTLPCVGDVYEGPFNGDVDGRDDGCTGDHTTLHVLLKPQVAYT